MTTTVPSPVTYTQVADGPIRDADGRALIDGTTTHVLVSKMMDEARAMARATGSVVCTQVETVHGVEVRAAWSRDDEDPEPDATFSLDLVVLGLIERGIAAHVDMTGGGCATIYAGGKHVTIDGTEERIDWNVVAGPGSYRYDADSTASLGEFYVGSNDDGASGDHVPLPDTITTAKQAVAWAVDAIARAVRDTDARSFARWNQRPCTSCKRTVVPGPQNTWITPDRSGCPSREDGRHTTVWH